MKIDTTKLDALYEHVKGNGSSDLAIVAKVLGVSPTEDGTVDAYVTALQKRNPEIFAEPAAQTLQVFLKTDDGLVEELEVVSTKKGRVMVQKIIPRDLVDVIVAGEKITVDLLALGRQGGNERLITAAEVAKG